MRKHLAGLGVLVALAASCGSDGGDTSISVAWVFESGSCASNGVETVRVTWGPASGATETKTFPCSAGSGALGSIGEGSTSIRGEGLDATGVTRFESFGTTVIVGAGGTGGRPIEITLHPKAADVLVAWSLQGKPCPGTVILPFYITLYKPPAVAGGPLTQKVKEIQESCSKGQATLKGIAPGDYIVEVNSRAVTPAVKLTAPVTVKAGENAQVALQS